MAEAAIIECVLNLCTSIIEQLIRREIQLIAGAEKDIERLESEFKSIRAVLVDAERQQVKEDAVKIWLEKLEVVAYDAEDVLFEWLTAMRREEVERLENKSSSFPRKNVYYYSVTVPCLGIRKIILRRDIAVKIEKINETLADIAREKDRYNFVIVEGGDGAPRHERLNMTSYVDPGEVKGRDSDINTLIKKLIPENNPPNHSLNVVSVVGMGGMGKTTVAQVVYGSHAITNNFHPRIWVCVSEPFDEVRVAKAILEQIEGIAPNLSELETMALKIRHHLQQKKFLLVFDDVSTEDFTLWEQIFTTLGSGACGSTVLVTTRSEKVAQAMRSKYTHRLGRLSSQDSWALFSKFAFSERGSEEFARFEAVGRRISDKCKGRPLTVKTIACLLPCKNSLNYWENVLNNEFWEMKEAGKLFPPLMLSYYDLRPELKRCFLFCAIFPKDSVIDADNLVQLWMAQGYLGSNENDDSIGQEYLQALSMRSFFEGLVLDHDGMRILSVKMHDMLHDFAQYLSKNKICVVEYTNPSDLERRIQLSGTRHLTVIRGEDKDFPTIPNVERLITLRVQSSFDLSPIVSQVDQIDRDVVCRLARVRALDLSRNRIGELPKEIGVLIKLKYLNLSHNPFRELPPALCDLFNLQTLNLFSCDHLRKLPREIWRLVNLRHLEIRRTDSLKTLPKGISKMKPLQTLTKFIVVEGQDIADPTFRLEDLNNLTDLRGRLEIEGLGLLTDADMAERAELHNKVHLSDLHLNFNPCIQNLDQDRILGALELHENLKSLQISSYMGTRFPDWTMRLTNLRQLTLRECRGCSNLPPLGQLPSLVTLVLDGLSAVVSIGPDFVGINSSINGDTRRSGSGFPKLKKLKISNMERWEKWDLSFDEERFNVMPCLRLLKVSKCERLRALPGFLGRRRSLKLRTTHCSQLRTPLCRK